MIGNDSLFGVMATFMESLHISYRECFEEIPYRVLLLMSKDKLHPVTGTRVKKGSGRDMLARRGARARENKDDK